MSLTFGVWAYTDVLTELARGMADSLLARIALFVCLLLGAVPGGWTGGLLGTALWVEDRRARTTVQHWPGCRSLHELRPSGPLDL